MWQMPASMGYCFPFDHGLGPVPPVTTTVWRGAQLVLATEENEHIVLDCLVPASGDAVARDGGPLEPITLRAHHLETVGATLMDDEIVRAWADSGIALDISLEERDGITCVHICQGDSTIDLALDSTT
jgi:hypothetical protein